MVYRVIGLHGGEHALITMGGRSAVTEVAKRATLSAAPAIEAIPKVFMIAMVVCYYRNCCASDNVVVKKVSRGGKWCVSGRIVPAKTEREKRKDQRALDCKTNGKKQR